LGSKDFVLRSWTAASLRLIWGTYLLLTSIYCLLAFLPYTYFALIKAPAYAWMPWFAQHHGVLYWALLAGVGAADWKAQRTRGEVLLFGLLALAGIYLVGRPFMASLQNNWAAYRWSLTALLPVMLVSARQLHRQWPAAEDEHKDVSLLGYSSGVAVAAVVTLLYVTSTAVRTHIEKEPLHFGLGKLELTGWSLISHTTVVILVISGLNLIRLATRRARRPTSWRLIAFWPVH
jgi:hypothetical protein